jgi:Outer membrane protein beta-barrel domain/AMIN domain
MNKTNLLLLMTVIAIAIAVPARAEIRSGGVTVSHFVGAYTLDGIQHLKTNVTGGLRIGYNLTRTLGIEGQVGIVPLESTKPNGPSDGFLYNVRLDMLYNFMPEKKFVPFLALGGGWSRGNSGIYHDNDDGTLDYGAGARYFLTDNLALRGDLRHILSFHSPRYGGTSYWNHFEYTASLSYQYGGKQSAAKAVAEPAPEPMPVTPPPPAPVEPSSPPVPEPAQPSSWQGGAMAAPAGGILISGMKVEENVLEFTTSEPIKNYKVLTLSQPSRLVIDVANGVNGLGTGTIAVNQLGVTTVRFESTPEYLRIILDAEEGRLIPYRIEETASGLKVIITTP